jgi:dihydroneopterin aldolase
MVYTYLIRLEKLTYFSYHGLEEHERKTGNRYEIDIAISLISEVVIENITQTVDYAQIARLTSKIMDKHNLLLEQLVFKIIEIIEDFYIKNGYLKDTCIKKIWVKASKFNPPMGYICEKSSVELTKEY